MSWNYPNTQINQRRNSQLHYAMSAKNIYGDLNKSIIGDENISRENILNENNNIEKGIYAPKKFKNSQHFENLAIGSFIDAGNIGERSNITLVVSKN